MTATTDDTTDEAITTEIRGAWSDVREDVAAEIKDACDGTPDLIDLRQDGEVWVRFKDNDTPFITMSGGLDADDLPAGCTLEGVQMSGNDTVSIKLNHRALN